MPKIDYFMVNNNTMLEDYSIRFKAINIDLAKPEHYFIDFAKILFIHIL